MSQPRDWRVIMAELNAENAQNNDSLELGDSWRAMPRRTEGVVNKTNGLYRRSALPALPVKNLYNFIIEKQPTDGRKTVTDSAPAPVTHPPPKLLTPSVEPITPENGENSDNLEFSQFLTAQIDGHKAVTSTPYPVRQIDANKSPKRTVNVQRSAADSPKKLFVPAPTRVPIGTPRSSKQLNNVGRRAIQPSDRNKMSSPTSVVSSTVHIVSDDDESERVKSPEKQLNVRKDERLPVIESAPDENCLPLDEDQQEQNDGTKKNAEEALFRRPDMVRRPLIKQIKLDPGDDQSKISNSTNNTQRSKKSKSNVNALLEGYIKVGESITNRTTNSVPLESSSSSTRRRLYKKGDSCNEEDILKDIEPLEQPSFVVNPVSAGYNGTFTKAKSISVQPNATVDGDLKSGNDARVEALSQDPKETAEPHAELTEAIQPPGTERNRIVDLTFDDGSENQSKLSDDGQEPTNSQKAHSNASPSSNDDQESVSDAPDQNTPSSDSPSGDDVHESTTDVQSPSANSNGKQVDDTEMDHPTANSTDQQNHMSAKHSSKRDLDEILQDWSDTVKPSNDQELVDRSGSSDSELEIHPPTVKKPSAKSKVRQVRSNSTKKPGTGTTSSKAGRRGTVRPNLDQIDEDDETEEDELSTASADVRNLTKNASNAKEAKKRTRKELPTKSKNEPVHSTQQEVIENDDDSDDSEQPSIDKLPRANTQRAVESKAKPPNKSRSKRDDIETDGDGVELSTKSKRKGNKQRAVDGNEPGADRKETDSKGASKGRERKDRDEDIVVESDSVLPARQTRKQRLNAEGDVTETDGKTKAVAASKGDKTNDVMETNDIEPAVAATSKSKGRKKRPNAEDDALEEVEIEAESARTSKRNQRKKRPAAEEAVEAETELPATSKSREKKRRLNAQNDATEDEAETELVTRSSKRNDNKKPANAEDNVRETDGNEAEQSKKYRTGKTGKKRVDVEEIAAEDDIEPQIEIGDSPAEDDTGNDIQSTAKSKVRKSQKRKHQSVADGKNLSTEQGGNFSSRVDGSMAKKRRKISKWERASESIFNYNSLKPREAATGIRQSSRERHIPASNLLLNPPIARAISSNRSALQRQNGSVQHRVQRRNQSVHTEGENVFSMLLNGSMDKEPPLITNLDGIEITQGFHKTVKNNLIIHHIPGETGPSYGYFTLEPGMVKRACRITWNLHIHVVSGPIQIITNDKSEQMVTGSFASLHSGTKYSLRNDGENSALVFFSQQANG